MDNFFGTVNGIINSWVWIAALYAFVFFIVVLWLALIFWTFKDARKRMDDPVVIGVAVLTAVVLPYMGALVYAILRPAEYLADVKERELEMMAMEQELLRACPSCGEIIKSDYLACPGCRHALRSACPSCNRVLEPGWKMCPYCAHDIKVKMVAPPLEQDTQFVEHS